ncbi:MAG: sigma-70 family RNA polymerase sigma factor [Pseudomonadota bacterium]
MNKNNRGNHVAQLSDGKNTFDQLGDIYYIYYPKLKAALLKSFGVGPPDPDDMIHKAFQKLLERSCISDIKDIHAFLWCTARNLTLEEKRKTQIHAKYNFEVEQIFFPLGGENSTPESILSAREELLIINQALEHMPPTRRRAFVLHKIDGLRVAEVARRLNMSRNPAQKHINKAMKDIALALDNCKRERKR